MIFLSVLCSSWMSLQQVFPFASLHLKVIKLQSIWYLDWIICLSWWNRYYGFIILYLWVDLFALTYFLLALTIIPGNAIWNIYEPSEDPLIKHGLEIVNSAKEQASPSGVRLVADSLWSEIFPKTQRCWHPMGCLVGNSNFHTFCCLIQSLLVFLVGHSPYTGIFLWLSHCLFKYAETTLGCTRGSTKDVFDCSRLQLLTWCKGTWWKSS